MAESKLLAAKQAGLIDAVSPYVLQLSASELYLSSDLIATVIDIAGEKCSNRPPDHE
jgi:hypothetical protein